MDRFPRKINVEQTVSYLNYAFAEALKAAAPDIGTKNTKGTELYKYQVDFCYLINEIENGADYIVPKLVSTVNEMIDELHQRGEPSQTTLSTFS